jgi:beta-lactamase regulating signal transducer with metallopeptidase domain
MESMNWLHNREVVALGWTLLHFCWQGTVIALLYAIANRAAVNASRNTRYGIAMVALALMPLVTVTTFIEQEQLLVQVPRNGREVVASQLGSLHNTIIHAVPLATSTVERSELWIAWNADQMLPWVVGIWLGGVLLLAVRAAGGWWRLEQIRCASRNAIPAEVESSFRRARARLRIRRKVALYISNEVISPLAMGVWHIAIILPLSTVMLLSPEHLEAVLAHEMAHVRRWDYLGNLLQTAVECLLFFHPAVWWISRRTRDLRELCCDEVAARSCADPAIYVEALLQLESHRTNQLQLATAFHGRGGSLLKRVKQLLGEEVNMEPETMGGVRIAVVGALVSALILGPAMAKGLKPAHNSTPLPEQNSQNSLNTAVSMAQPVAAPASKETPKAMPRHPAATLPEVAAANPLESPMPGASSAPQGGGAQQAASAPAETKHHDGADYLDRMRDAGYTLDLNKDLDSIVALRSTGVTPEYARGMAQAGFGTPTLHELIALKSVGVTPEYAKTIAAMNFGTPTLHDLIGLKAQGITPEYASGLKASGIAVTTLHELMGIHSVGVTPEYAKAMAAAGFGGISTHDLISMRAQGITPEYAQWVKQTFPDADMHALRKAVAFQVNADFVAKAKSHGFNDASLDKLVKLKMTGLLD